MSSEHIVLPTATMPVYIWVTLVDCMLIENLHAQHTQRSVVLLNSSLKTRNLIYKTMPTDFDKFDDLEREIADFRNTLPKTANEMSDSQLKQYSELLDRQQNCIELIQDRPRK